MYQVLYCLSNEHDVRLVALGGAVCLLASAVAISLFHRARAAQGRARLVWTALDAAVGGSGIWATHFIAMLAYGPGTGAAYNVPVTALSLVLAVSITFVGLGLALSDGGRTAVAIGGAIVGLGVAAMHYTGMWALEISAHIDWSPVLVTVSVLFGVILASLALSVAARRDDLAHGTIATILMTLAIVAHHFTAMGAVLLRPDPMLATDSLSISPAVLSFLTAAAAVGILGISLLAALMDRQVKGQLRRQKVLLDTALENMSQGLCMFDAAGRIVLCNERYSVMMDRIGIPLIGRSLRDVLRDQKALGRWDGDPDEFFAEVMADARAGQGLTRTFDQNGRWIRVVSHPMHGGGWVSTFEDITEWLQAQEKISHMARHDALTGLPNRVLFREKLEKGLRLRRSDEQFAVLCLDLDHFKDINDSLGHPVGDALLGEVGLRLAGCCGDNDTVARLGGDEFAIVQLGATSEESAASTLAGRIVEALTTPFEISDHHIVIGGSIGIALSPQDGIQPDDLLMKADLALYRAKADGRGTYRFFETGMDARAQARRVLELDLRTALRREEFEVYYQPIRDVAHDRLVAFEALVRWNHPHRGQIAPSHFIPVAEESGLITPLGDFVLRTACQDAARWPDDVAIAVNLSPAQFKGPNLVASVMDALAESGLAPNRLELEITESILLQNTDATLATLHELRGRGVRISLDDFGTGYSSLSYLRSFPFDKIKIDRSFIAELPTRDDSMAIVRAVTGLGRSLGIVTTAEGVENDEQLELLRREGCTQAQGYLFSVPRPVSEVGLMLSKPRLRASA